MFMKKITPYITCLIIISQAILPMQAFATIPVADVANTGTHANTTAQTTTNTVTSTYQKIVDNVLDPLGYAVATILMQFVVKRITNWASSGFEGNPFYIEDLKQDAKNIGLQQYDYFVSQVEYVQSPYSKMLGQMSIVASPFRSQGGEFTGSQFTLDKVIGPNWQEFTGSTNSYNTNVSQQFGDAGKAAGAQAVGKADFTKGGWSGYRALLDAPNNPYGAETLMRQELNKELAKVQADQKFKISLGQGFLGVEKCIDWGDPKDDAAAIKSNQAFINQYGGVGNNSYGPENQTSQAYSPLLNSGTAQDSGPAASAWDYQGFGGSNAPATPGTGQPVVTTDPNQQGNNPTAPSTATGQVLTNPSTSTTPRVCKNSITQTPGQILKDSLSDSLKAPLARLGLADKWTEVLSSSLTSIITSFVQGGIKKAGDAIQESTQKNYTPVNEGLTDDDTQFAYNLGNGTTISGPSSLQFTGTNDPNATVSPDVILNMDEELYGPRMPKRDANGLLIVVNGEIQYEKNPDGSFKRNNDPALGGKRGALVIIADEVAVLNETRTVYAQFPFALQTLDQCLPGPDYKWQTRLDSAFQRKFQKTQLQCAKNADDTTESWQCRHMRDGPYEISVLKQMISQEMISNYWNIPSAQPIIDTINRTGQYQNELSRAQSDLNERRRIKGLIEDIANRYSGWNANTSPADKAQLYRSYLALAGDLPIDQLVDERRNTLEKAKIDLARIGTLTNSCKAEVVAKAKPTQAADPAAGDAWRLPFGIAYSINQSFCYLRDVTNDQEDAIDEAFTEGQAKYNWTATERQLVLNGLNASGGADKNDRPYPFPVGELFFPGFDDIYFLTLYNDDRENVRCEDFYKANPQDYIGPLDL